MSSYLEEAVVYKYFIADYVQSLDKRLLRSKQRQLKLCTGSGCGRQELSGTTTKVGTLCLRPWFVGWD